MPFMIPQDPGEMASAVTKAKSGYTRRDRRQAADQDLYELRTGGTGTLTDVNQSDLITLPDGKILIQKAVAMSASVQQFIKVNAQTTGESDLAQRVQNLLYWWRDQAEDQHQQGIHNPLTTDEHQYMYLRGWLVGRLLFNPENMQFPWQYDLLDPMTIYPRMGGNKTLWIGQMYRPTVAEVLGDWGEAAEQLLQGRADHDRVKFTAMYTDTQFAAAVDDQWLKEPVEHGYGFNPLIVVTANGAAYQATERRDNQWQEYQGTGLLEAVRDAIRNKEDVVTMLHVLLEKEAEPPSVLSTDSEDHIAEVDLQVGGRNVIGEKDKLELLHVGPSINDLMPLAQLHQSSIWNGALGQAAFADSANFASGYHEAVAQAGSRHAIYPYVRALELYYRTLYRNVVKLYTKFGAGPLSYVTVTPGQPRVWNAIQPMELQGTDIHIDVEYDDITPQNEQQKAMIGEQALDKHILDSATVRSKYFGDRNPELTNQKVLADLILQNPMLIQIASLAAALQSGDPFMTNMVQMMQQQMAMQQQQQLMEQMQPGSAQGQPGSSPQPRVPNNVLPNEMTPQGAGHAPNSPNVQGAPPPPNVPGQ